MNKNKTVESTLYRKPSKSDKIHFFIQLLILRCDLLEGK